MAGLAPPGREDVVLLKGREATVVEVADDGLVVALREFLERDLGFGQVEGTALRLHEGGQ